ncbi:AAA family ATPase [Nonomuraea lactucae]|uniref:nSTAND1 domain-containing NTPase n=1 Tax=Nonomuraea lactucae TaxID=2249762 RepID=UPI000DE51D3A|nr:AAA family ATPase [Nonomuraea lactucae]
MDPDEPPLETSAPSSGDGGVHLEAHASGQALVNQAGRDQHFHYGGGQLGPRRAAPGSVVGECPYPALAAFGREHARWFFGRDALIAELVARLDERLLTGGIQMVVASSGAGKSSLLRAGLLARLEQGALPGSNRWPALVFTPTSDPVRALAEQICSLTGADAGRVADRIAADPERCEEPLREALRSHIGGEDPGARVVVVADQLEELFSLCSDDGRRRVFVESLTRMADPRNLSRSPPVALVVAGLRADFYAAWAGHALHPTRDVGLDIEPGLVELLLRDLGVTAGAAGDEATGYEAGRLTHQDLEEATAAWERAGRDSALLYRGSRLTIAHAWATTRPMT